MADLIDRQAAIDFIDAGRICNPNEPRWSDNEIVNFLKSRPSAQPDVPDTNVGDLISRQAAIDAVGADVIERDRPPVEVKYWNMGLERASIILGNLPSAQRIGRWIFETLDGAPGYRPTVMFCSKCGRVSIADYSYCPNCGVRMEEQE